MEHKSGIDPKLRFPNLKHDGYFQNVKTPLTKSPEQLERQRKFISQTR